MDQALKLLQPRRVRGSRSRVAHSPDSETGGLLTDEVHALRTRTAGLTIGVLPTEAADAEADGGEEVGEPPGARSAPARRSPRCASQGGVLDGTPSPPLVSARTATAVTRGVLAAPCSVGSGPHLWMLRR